MTPYEYTRGLADQHLMRADMRPSSPQKSIEPATGRRRKACTAAGSLRCRAQYSSRASGQSGCRD